MSDATFDHKQANQPPTEVGLSKAATSLTGVGLQLRFHKRLQILALLDFVFGAVALAAFDDFSNIPFVFLSSLLGLALPLFLGGRMLYAPIRLFIDKGASFDDARKRLFTLAQRTTIMVAVIVAGYAVFKFVWDPLHFFDRGSFILDLENRWRLVVTYTIFMPFLAYFLISDNVARMPVDLLQRYNLASMAGQGRFIQKIAIVVVICSVLPLMDQVLELHNRTDDYGVPMGDQRLASQTIEEGVNALIALVVATIVVLRSIDGPLRRLLNALARVRGGDLRVRVPVSAADDLGLLTAAFNNMVESLRYRDHLRFGAGINPDTSLGLSSLGRDDFSRQTEEVDDGADAKLELHSYKGTILIVSLDEFDALSERLPPERSFQVIENFYAMVSDAVLNRGGVIVDRMSNMVMAVFREEDTELAETEAGQPGRALRAFNDIRHLLRDQVFLIGLQLNIRGAIAEGDLFEASPEGRTSQNFSADNVLLLGAPMDRAMDLMSLRDIETDSIIIDDAVSEAEYAGFQPFERRTASLEGHAGRGDIHILTGERRS